MRVYCLDEPPSSEELADLADMLDPEVELVRIPHLIPDGSDVSLELALAGREDVARILLKAAGILADYGRRVGFVIPRDMVSYSAFGEAIFGLTGFYPYLVQTASHREKIGNPGCLRVIDMHGMMTS